MKEIKILLAALCINHASLSFAQSSETEKEFNAGLAALQRGHYATAYRSWIDIAQAGNLRAKSNIGYLYEHGLGVSQNYTKAMDWYLEAAEAGLAEAQHNLGMMYAEARGTDESWGRALVWFKRAAEQNSVESLYMIGLSYYRGLGQIEDKSQAYRYFKLSAERGYADAQYMLSYMLLAAEGPSKNADAYNAFVWATLGLEGGQVQAEEVRDLARMVLENSELLDAENEVNACQTDGVRCARLVDKQI
jgi:TPR repeat protein